jgi:hypothetical protein
MLYRGMPTLVAGFARTAGGSARSRARGLTRRYHERGSGPDKPEMRIWVWATSAGVARLLNGPYQAFAPVAQRIAHLTTDLKGGPNERAHSHPSRSRTSQRVRCKMIMRSEAAAKPQKLQKLRQMVQGLSKSRREQKVSTARLNGVFVLAGDDLDRLLAAF